MFLWVLRQPFPIDGDSPVSILLGPGTHPRQAICAVTVVPLPVVRLDPFWVALPPVSARRSSRRHRLVAQTGRYAVPALPALAAKACWFPPYLQNGTSSMSRWPGSGCATASLPVRTEDGSRQLHARIRPWCQSWPSHHSPIRSPALAETVLPLPLAER